MIVIIMFVIGISTIVGYVMLKSVNTQISGQADFSDTGKTIINNATNKYVGLFDNTFLVIMIGLALGSILLASQIDVSPVFFPVSIVLYIVLIIFSASVGNAYYNMASTEGLSTFTEDFRVMPFIFNHLVEIMVGIGFIIGVVMYAKTRE